MLHKESPVRLHRFHVYRGPIQFKSRASCLIFHTASSTDWGAARNCPCRSDSMWHLNTCWNWETVETDGCALHQKTSWRLNCVCFSLCHLSVGPRVQRQTYTLTRTENTQSSKSTQIQHNSCKITLVLTIFIPSGAELMEPCRRETQVKWVNSFYVWNTLRGDDLLPLCAFLKWWMHFRSQIKATLCQI